MFTGLIESVGRIRRREAMSGGFAVYVETPLAGELRAGDSLAVDGVCLTAVSMDDGAVRLEVSPETARLTTLEALAPGLEVNLERALRAGDRLGGHFVQGHVDGVGRIEALRPDGDSYWLAVAFPESLAGGIVHKGSIAVDGISLTVARLERGAFGVQIVPYTWEHTALRTRAAGDPVNLETDILGKYVARALAVERERPARAGAATEGV
jgi:riboflavin synthase